MTTDNNCNSLTGESPATVAAVKNGNSVAVIIPAFNEGNSILRVLEDIPTGLADEVIVVDNNSTDNTGPIARAAGARVLYQSRRGYGSACQTGVAYALGRGYDIVVFLDADYSDHPEEMTILVEQITANGVELVIGSRTLGNRQQGAMLPQAVFGNWLATRLIRLFWKVRFTDLGPFRAIRSESLRRLDMRDADYGWTVEMQVKAAGLGMACAEVPVSYRKRIGVSKITGTIQGTIRAGYKILLTIARYALLPKSVRGYVPKNQ